MRWLVVLSLALVLGLPSSAAALPTRTVIDYDLAANELPEGIAFDRRGAMYVSIASLGQLRRYDRDGTETTVLDVGPDPGGLFSLLGVATGRRGTVYVAAPTADPAWHGVIAVDRDGTARRLPGTEDIRFPNDVAVAPGGDLYVTDSVGGAIWRVPRHGTAHVWLAHELLAGTGLVNPFPIGANGIEHAGRSLYVANTERRLIVEVRVRRRGRPGVPRVVHTFAREDHLPDGIAVRRGAFYVAMVVASEVVRVRADGEVAVLATAADGLSIPASLDFGVRGRDRRTLYVTNFAIPSFTPDPDPGVVAIDLGRDRHRGHGAR